MMVSELLYLRIVLEPTAQIFCCCAGGGAGGCSHINANGDGSLFYKKFLNTSPIFYSKNPQITKYVKNGPIFQENP